MREMTHTHDQHLVNDIMMQTAPSVFAQAPRNDVSDRYGFVPTINVIDALRDVGWMPVDAAQKQVRVEGNRDFTKHLVRFRRLDDDIIVGDSVVEILLTNSHDRSSGFIMHAGIFRMACANGIVIADSTFNKVNVRHNSHAAERVIEGSYEVIENVPKIAAEVDSMRAVGLTQQEQEIFALTAFDYAHPKLVGNDDIITSRDNIAQQLVRPARRADVEPNLWNTFNRVQERLLKGGLRTTKLDDKTRRGTRATTTRKVGSIDKDIKLNKALWEMATQMRALKIDQAEAA